tara:strand:- start:223 stop:351 length:129 start_codon:yes stop_codon:yes gene_type:complete
VEEEAVILTAVTEMAGQEQAKQNLVQLSVKVQQIRDMRVAMK